MFLVLVLLLSITLHNSLICSLGSGSGSWVRSIFKNFVLKVFDTSLTYRIRGGKSWSFRPLFGRKRGGKNETINVGYIASLVRQGEKTCSGIVLDSLHILTASNCLLSYTPDGDPVINVDPVGMGVVTRGSRTMLSVSHICVHNAFLNDNYDQVVKEETGVAVITLEKPLVFKGMLYPARISKSEGSSGGNLRGVWWMGQEEASIIPRRKCPPRLMGNGLCARIPNTDTTCKEGDIMGGALEGQDGVVGLITHSSCMKRASKRFRMVGLSPIPKWIYPLLTSDYRDQCY